MFQESASTQTQVTLGLLSWGLSPSEAVACHRVSQGVGPWLGAQLAPMDLTADLVPEPGFDSSYW